MKLQDMSLAQLEEYLDRLRMANQASGLLDMQEYWANEEWKRRKAVTA